MHANWGLALVMATAMAGPSEADSPQDRPPDLAQLSLEQLMDIEVVSASKRDQKLAEAAVAVYVITQEDLRRLGATSIAEALRMAPGVTVARIDSNKWAVSARGFPGRFSNKLLVLIDGRSVYTPLFSGTHWDVQDMLLEDVDRIEVIRGPGATLWGANAVNGVINIITKHSRETLGGLVVGGTGSHERGLAGARYGAKLGEKGHLRVFGKYIDRGSFDDPSGAEWGDAWHVLRGGFRADRDAGSSASLTVQGDLYDGRAGGREAFIDLTPPFSRIVEENATLSGGNLLARWKRIAAGGSETSLQVYYDRTSRHDAIEREVRNTVDLDWQHRIPLGSQREIVWGLGYRRTSDDLGGSPLGVPDPTRRQDDLLSGFLQGELVLKQDRLRLIAGSKVERNDYTGFEVQPNLRLLWTPSERTRAWAAVSRAVRTPSRFEDDIRGGTIGVTPDQSGPLVLVALNGNRDFDAEDLLAWEAGFRAAPNHRLFVDVAVFFNAYNHLRTIEPGVPFFELRPPPPHLVLPVRPENLSRGNVYGGEVAASFSPSRRWKLNLAYSFLRLDLHPSPASRDPIAERDEGLSPRHQIHLRSYLDLTSRLSLDGAFYHVARLPAERIPAYTRLDLRLAWQATRSLELSAIGQDLLDERHQEAWPDPAQVPAQISRRVCARIAWRF